MKKNNIKSPGFGESGSTIRKERKFLVCRGFGDQTPTALNSTDTIGFYIIYEFLWLVQKYVLSGIDDLSTNI